MDTEEIQELAHLKHSGRKLTDKGPFFYAVKWGAYKGARRSELGGATIGFGVGTLIGLGTAAIVAGIAGGFSAVVTLPILAGCMAGGTLFGMHEFSHIGTVTGAVSSAHNLAEERIKEYEDSKFAKLEAKIDALAKVLTGKKCETIDSDVREAAKREAEIAHEQDNNYSVRHTPESCSSEGSSQLYFPFVGLVGTLAGLAIGGLMAWGGLTHGLMTHLGYAGIALEHAGLVSAGTLAVTGLFGASFGINRDIFRRVFDVTDPLFEGRLPELSPAKCQDIVQEQHVAHPSPSPELSHARVASRLNLDAPRHPIVFVGEQGISCHANILSSKEMQHRALLELDPASMRMQ